MSLPYEGSTSGEQALNGIRKILTGFGCTKFGTMVDTEACTITVQFVYRDRPVQVTASAKGYAAAWLKEHPYNVSRARVDRAAHERRALEIGQTAVYSILRDWIKGQITAIECGVMTFEGAFLGQLMLPSGRTVLEEVSHRKLLPAPNEQDAPS